MDYSDIFTWLFLFLLLGVAYWYLAVPRNLPPGPKGLPIVGALPFLGKTPYITLVDFAKKYGNITQFYMGSRSVVVLNDYETIKEALVKQGEIFSGRVEDEVFRGSEIEDKGVVATDGEYWRQHRRFIISNLRSSGVGKNYIEPQILNEIQHFISELRKHVGKPYDMKQLLSFSLANNILLLVTGSRYEYDDDFMNKLVELSNVAVAETPPIQLTLFFPWMKHIPFIEKLLGMEFMISEVKKINKTLQQIIDNRPLEGQDDDSTYIQAFLTEKKKRIAQNADDGIFTDLALLNMCRDLFMAGSETSASTLLWAMLYLTYHPEVQAKIHQEIDRTIGREREVSYSDRTMTPFAEATIAEVHRVASLVPLSAPHRNIRDTVLCGYNIPKSTIILPNVYAVHNEPKLWGDPENFRPERFINQEGKLTIPEYLIPFSVGKRVCAGEPLARMELYLYLVSLMQNFRFVPTKEVEQTLEAKSVCIRIPKCTTICMEAR